MYIQDARLVVLPLLGSDGISRLVSCLGNGEEESQDGLAAGDGKHDRGVFGQLALAYQVLYVLSSSLTSLPY